MTSPRLVIHGDGDTIPLASSREITASLLNARLLVIPDGHFPHVEQPEAFFGSVQRFLSGSWPDEAEICH